MDFCKYKIHRKIKEAGCLFIIVFALFSIRSFAQENEQILKGCFTSDTLAKSHVYSWFQISFEEYQPDKWTVHKIRKNIKGINFIVFAGTWCSDTQALLGPFFKVLKKSKIDEKAITLYFLDREKNSGNGREKDFAISAIPTIIILREKKEIGRIVESINKSIEEELLSILSGSRL